MTKDALPELRWGIIGCGLISSWFVADLCLARQDATTKHTIQALGSSSIPKAKKFLHEHCPSQSPSLFTSYQDVYNDPEVDIVYIGTPHTLHLQNALDAINAGKHVLCEKPVSLNADMAQKMMDAARKKGVFLMEAMWTRFFPIVQKLQSLLHEEKIVGDIASVMADFSLCMPIGENDPSARTASLALGAGALLDIGLYTLTWASLVLDTSPSRDLTVEPGLTASMVFHSETDLSMRIDEEVAVVLKYPDLNAQAICTASLRHRTGPEFAHVHGPKGSIAIGGGGASAPSFLVVRLQGQEEKRLDLPVEGRGFHYEADAVAQDIRAGRLENATCSHCHSLTIMNRMDRARALCGLKYPQEA
ncbi:putative D-xylose 1-dehydrogenase [Penicillium rolfsii]|nr:putative D-xylose 1-dehydrogenase [Penicillium rolfsii]